MFQAYWVLYNKLTKEYYTGSQYTTKTTDTLWEAQKYCEKHIAENAKQSTPELADFEAILT